MYFNSEINIDLESLPQLLKCTYLNLKTLYNSNKEWEFLNLAEFFEASIKNCFIEGNITESQQKILFHVIGY